jgi:hypothetical protein
MQRVPVATVDSCIPDLNMRNALTLWETEWQITSRESGRSVSYMEIIQNLSSPH